MIKKVLIIFSISILTGCTSTATVKLNQSSFKKVEGKSLTLTTSDKPDFSAMTAGKASFGLLGAMAMISKGNDIVQRNNIPDPAVIISKNIANKLIKKYSMKPRFNIIAEPNDSVKKLVLKYGQYDFIVDVRTINWGFGYFPTNWNNYRVLYSSKLRLIDTNTRSVIAESFCSSISSKNPQPPSYNQLLSNGATRLKSELITAANHCTKKLLNEIL